jgi:hypothetical protein
MIVIAYMHNMIFKSSWGLDMSAERVTTCAGIAMLSMILPRGEDPEVVDERDRHSNS